MTWKVDGSKEKFVDKKTIQNSDVFLVLMTKHWIQETVRIQELEYAKTLGKPVAVAIFDGVDPEPYLKDANVIAKRVFDREDVKARTPLADALIRDFLEEVKTKIEGENR